MTPATVEQVIALAFCLSGVIFFLSAHGKMRAVAEREAELDRRELTLHRERSQFLEAVSAAEQGYKQALDLQGKLDAMQKTRRILGMKEGGS